MRAQGFDERFVRCWRFYLAYCAAGFTTRSIDVGHFTFLRRLGPRWRSRFSPRRSRTPAFRTPHPHCRRASPPCVPDARAQGGGELSWYGLAVYDGYLWSTDGSFSFDEPFALDLHYQRSLKGAKIAERSVEEIRALGGQDAADLARWGSAMAQIFPDVRKGDHIAGVHVPGKGARFFHNGRPIGEIADPKFARAFFGIWLDPRTSRPEFRTKLLGRS